MDGPRFDGLTRTLADPRSRRGAVVALLGGTLSLLGRAETAAKKKKGKKKKKNNGTIPVPPPVPPGSPPASPPLPPVSCVPDCSGGRNCGSDGCTATCGSCTPPQSCGGGGTPGVCGSSSACTATSCPGGRACQANGTCACPPDKPVSGVCGNAPDQCRECCTSGNCQGNQFCNHDLGSICVCPAGLHFCGGICRSCCKTEDCLGGRHFADGFICNVWNACVCQEGRTACNKADGTGQYCADLQDDEFNCGQCGFPCGPWVCRNGGCTPP